MLTILHYQIKEKLYESDNSRIYRAENTKNKQSVILKVLNNEFPTQHQLSRFRAEYEMSLHLSDVDGVARVLDIQSYKNGLVLVYNDGQNLALTDWLNQTKPKLADKLNIAIQLAHVIGQLHEKDVIHKDINPANILWQPQHKKLTLIDLGISTRLSQEHREFQHANQLEGTLAYISPEQTGRLNQTLDYRSDLYSFGVFLYKLFADKLPFEGLSGIELVHAHIALPPRALNKVNLAIPEVISNIVMKLLEKNPDDRYQSAAGVHYDFSHCLSQLSAQNTVPNFELAAQDLSLKFQIPQKLYGREQQVADILAAFQRTSSGSKELTLISGYSGTGKSALVNEVHKPLTAKRGLFVASKFDQFQRDVPYFAWASALTEFFNLLLKEDETSLVQWQQLLIEGLGNLAAVVTKQVPVLELIIGKQEAPQELSGEQALNRFNYAIAELFKTICRKDSPLVLFIDDWQWADSASINLLKYLLQDNDIVYLQLIGAYRDNEVDSAHPFSLAIREIEASGGLLNQISISNLPPKDVRALLSDTLHNPPNLDALQGHIFEKTGGNAFFLVQLLKNLHKDGLLDFNIQQKCWLCDVDKLSQLKVTDNVVDLMAYRLGQLSAETQTSLNYAACIGSRFDLESLSMLLHKDSSEVAIWLDSAIYQGIIKPLSPDFHLAKYDSKVNDIQYQFIHDRIQDAAYSQVEIEKAKQVHLNIGRAMLERLTDQQITSRVFDLVKHFAHAKDLLSNAEVDQAVALHIQAGDRAREATAYQPALSYYITAIELIGQYQWQQRDELLLRAAEVAFLSKDYDKMEAWVRLLLDNTKTLSNKIQALTIRLQAYTAQNRLEEAVDIALSALEMVNIKLPRKAKDPDVMLNLLATKFTIGKKSVNELLALPEMEDDNLVKGMQIMGLTIPPAYWAEPNLVFLLIFAMTKNSVKHGYSAMSSFGYSWWGVTECAVLGNIDRGYEIGRFGIELAKTHNMPVHQPRFYYGWLIKNFKHHIRESIPELYEAYKLSLEQGDFEYASYSLNNQMQALLHSAHPLPQLLEKMSVAQNDLAKFQFKASMVWHAIWHQVALNLHHGNEQPHILAGTAYNELESIEQHTNEKDASSLFLVYCAKLQLSVIFNQNDQAKQDATNASAFIKGGVGMFAVPLFHYYQSLTLLQDVENLSGLATFKQLKTVKANLKLLTKWAKHSPENHQHRCLLIQAELARVTNKSAKAAEFYDLAIEAAQKQGFTQDLALAFEKATRFYWQQERKNFALYFLKQALYHYKSWGAYSKVEVLEQEFRRAMPLMAQTEQQISTLTSSSLATATTGNQSLDLASILKATQSISQEIVFSELLKILMQIAMENAGAQKGILFFRREYRLEPVAQASLVNDKLEFSTLDADTEHHIDYPRSVFNVTTRTGQQVLLESAINDNQYRNDEYIEQHQVKSLISLPIHQQGELVGVIYLENNAISGAFDSKRVEILSLLSSQAAISLINANHYAFLEAEVSERTKEIEEKNQQLNYANEAKSEFLAKMSHEIRTPMNAVIGLSKLALRTELTDEQQDFLSKILDSAEVLLGIINDILDFSKIEAGKMSIETVPFELEKLLERVVNVCALRAYSKGLELIIDISPDVPNSLLGDPLRLQQILVNLANNAVKFTETGHVAISICVVMFENDMLTLEVSVEDTGIGMSEQQLARLFSSFSQADQSTTRKFGGTGLGLAICKQLVDLMGGQIWAESEPKKGSCFNFTLPIKMAQEQSQRNFKGAFADLNLLVVDDNPTARKVVVEMLKTFNANVTIASDGQEAVTLVEDHRKIGKNFDLIIMDWQMPNLDGIEASKQIKDMFNSADTPSILMISAYDRDRAKQLSEAAGIERFLEKPVNQSSLVDAIADCILPDRIKVGSLATIHDQSLQMDLSAARVLLVEDNALNRQVAVGFLQETGVQLDFAENGRVAVEKVMQNDYDLVLMDIQMPEMDGLTATGKIRQFASGGELPIVAMTAHAMEGERQKSLNAGMNDHLTKPIDPDQLFEVMERWLDNSLVRRTETNTSAELSSEQYNETLSQLSGCTLLNWQTALAKLQGNSELYLNLLIDFVSDYQNLASDVQGFYQQKEWARLFRFAHSLKSNASYIGAKQLAQAAKALEQSSEQHQATQKQVDNIINLSQQLFDELPELSTNDDKKSTSVAFDSDSLQECIERLLPLLENNDAEADAVSEELVSLCQSTQWDAAAKNIMLLIEDIEYKDAIAALEALTTELTKTC